ncbi:MAG: DsbA family protein [Nitrospirae bacterium]|nr:DsbA family protein [Nitrospirota bacterium]MBI3377373.1 DsbA family protein [Nitrospirota bacterium]
MMFKKMLLVLPLLAVAFSPLSAEAEIFIKGVYTKLPVHQFKFDGKTVEVIEFMSFYCDGCYSFEKAIPAIKGNFPKKIKWKTVPIYWGKGSPKPGEAYFLAEEAGKGEKMKEALFRAHFVEKKNIGDVKVLEEIGKKIGLGLDFSKRLRAGDKARDVQKALDMAGAYGVEETPTLIIAGNIMTNPHAFNHNIEAFRENVMMILGSILK